MTLANKPPKTRFAPSPTGYLHVGGARTALYAWLYARRHSGQFVLRIEDTDLERSTPEAVAAILEGMTWLGLQWDEGPYYQTQHFERYRQVVQQLLDSGHAYRCYCSKQRLQSLRQEQQAAHIKPRYDGCCRDKSPSAEQLQQPFVVRFKTPLDGEVSFDDQVHGTITVANEQLDDLIIMRSDGVPTYHLSVVVDDWDTEITHVIRGDDHINNTPRQIHILRALGAPQPVYAHVPMILGADGKRLSKRHGAVSVLQYRSDGILPEALLNYLLRLGWSHGDQEIFSLQEMQQLFNLEHISHAPAAFDPLKLAWLNQHYIKQMPAEDLAELLRPQLQQAGVSMQDVALHEHTEHGPALVPLVRLLAERVKTLVELAAQSKYFYIPPSCYEVQAQAKLDAAAVPLLTSVRDGLVDIAWLEEEIAALLKAIVKQHAVKFPHSSAGRALAWHARGRRFDPA